MDSGGEWCTYVQAAKRLHKSHGAIRQMALRGQLQRVRGNDGKARVLVVPGMERAAHERTEHAGDVQPERPAHVQRIEPALVHALESHIKTLQGDNEMLKEHLATAELRLAEAEAERARAIEAFASLADRLDELAAANQRARPWWRRLAG
jgi:chromosome segregation ATPase